MLYQEENSCRTFLFLRGQLGFCFPLLAVGHVQLVDGPLGKHCTFVGEMLMYHACLLQNVQVWTFAQVLSQVWARGCCTYLNTCDLGHIRTFFENDASAQQLSLHRRNFFLHVKCHGSRPQ